jgi:uncharacterized integral membrane protein
MNNLWKRWTINCAAGELLGIACAGGIAFLANLAMGESQTIAAKLAVLGAMMFAGLVEGLILGYLQWRVLVSKFTKLPRREWIFYTALIGVLGWFLGMLPSLFFVVENTDQLDFTSSVDFTNPILFLLLSVGSGLLLGSLFGLFQWFSLRKHAQKAYKWILANALGWGMGLGWIYLFASVPTVDSTLIFTIFMGLIGGVLAGLSVGGVTGYFLLKLEVSFPENRFTGFERVVLK